MAAKKKKKATKAQPKTTTVRPGEIVRTDVTVGAIRTLVDHGHEAYTRQFQLADNPDQAASAVTQIELNLGNKPEKDCRAAVQVLREKIAKWRETYVHRRK